MLVITLSTIPTRFHMLGKTLACLLDQTSPADAIEVWIPKQYRRFPDMKFELPEVPEGVTVRVTEQDLGPATKVLPAARAYRNTDALLLYCDDDRLVPRTWVESFRKMAARKPGCAIAVSGTDIDRMGVHVTGDRPMPRAKRQRSLYDLRYRGRRVVQKLHEIRLGRKLAKPMRSWLFARDGYVDIMEGCGGVLVTPDMFDDAAFDIPDKVWTVDDIWLSGMLARKNIPIWTNSLVRMPNEQAEVNDALYTAVIEGLDRTEANLACVRYLQDQFGIWPEAAAH